MGLFSNNNDDNGDRRCRSPRRDKPGKPGTHYERSHGDVRPTERDQPRRQRRLEGNHMLGDDDHHMPRSWP